MLFFDQFIVKVFGFEKTHFDTNDMKHPWTAGCMSVVEFVQQGGSIKELADTLGMQALMHEKAIKSGMAEELLKKIQPLEKNHDLWRR